ncbi:MAG: endonuclease domain-containing protein [Paludibacteraceae bacterium]|nr:endonuclease domain-containing protein [Paludibacteraceae bacterium]
MGWQVAEVSSYALLNENAKTLRDFPTDAEKVFWSLAKSSGFGEKCRRQYIIGDYIVDFFFRKSLVIVEIDGGYHFTEEQQHADKHRQTWLENNGYTVLRFSNEQVMCDTDNVIKSVKQYLKYGK